VKLYQIKIEYAADQDRLLMRVSTTGSEEVSLWLTRRCVARLWPVLVSAAQSDPQIATQANPQARQALLEFQRERALGEADFSKPYQNSEPVHPMGAEPLLVARIVQRRAQTGHTVLGLLPRKGQGVFISLDTRLLHGLMRLLQNAAARADWGVNLSLPQASLGSSGSPVLN
jgi:hypothetical protein